MTELESVTLFCVSLGQLFLGALVFQRRTIATSLGVSLLISLGVRVSISPSVAANLLSAYILVCALALSVRFNRQRWFAVGLGTFFVFPINIDILPTPLPTFELPLQFLLWMAIASLAARANSRPPRHTGKLLATVGVVTLCGFGNLLFLFALLLYDL